MNQSASLEITKLNNFNRCDYFKEKGIKDIRCLLSKGDIFLKYDLTKAYFQITLSESSVVLTAFWKKNRMHGVVLGDLGIDTMPRVVAKVTGLVVQHMRDFPHWLSFVSYRIDGTRMAQPVSSLLEGYRVARHGYTSLGVFEIVPKARGVSIKNAFSDENKTHA